MEMFTMAVKGFFRTPVCRRASRPLFRRPAWSRRLWVWRTTSGMSRSRPFRSRIATLARQREHHACQGIPGGILVMTGANSAVGLRSMAARYLFLDEVDAYPGDVDGEGDPIKLALARTRTFARRKVFMVSTPKITGTSRIEAAYEESDQRQYWVPCPACRQYQVLQFPQIRWPKGEPERTVYICEHCEAAIENHQKHWMLPRGQWRAAAPGRGKAAGFHLSSLYSPVGWFSWADAAKMFSDAQKNPALLQVCVNTVFGETWAQQGDAPEWRRLYDRREEYRIGTVPAGGLFLTAGVDIQKDRIELEVVAWGRGKESWSVDYQVLEGKTAEAPVWAKLTQWASHWFDQ